MFKKTPSLDVMEIDEIKNKHRIIDIRTDVERKRFGKLKYKTAQAIPEETLRANPEKYLDKDKEYYILCESGRRSKKTVKFLNKEGYNTINLKGGHFVLTRFGDK